ncbi:Vacuolar protein sorting-associated protein 54 [Frankliniella fusca]|uniref:Vacuolar protein sorting-associated protein 54 n=1 Tax=Frankliniella fusca TaxID=407009 RepID=A0AAE1IX85_9NEOP|nr:Vacuolar protein sorting-associated protein 54 [Frankliniella fusca]
MKSALVTNYQICSSGNGNSAFSFRTQKGLDFMHLRERHCTREGGSYVCHYGHNGVCSSLPVDGVSDADYEDHVLRHHVGITNLAAGSSNGDKKRLSNLEMSKMSGNSSRRVSYSDAPHMVTGSSKWTVYSGSQNLPAVLNDPNRGKQKDFFTKLWGDSFVERTDIPPSPYLPEITAAHFESYLRKIGKRHKKHERMKVSAPQPDENSQLLHSFPNLRVPPVRPADKFKLEVDAIPRIFLQSNFSLSDPETFNAVYPITGGDDNATALSTPSSSIASGKLLQEQLSHYLDMVEVQIAHQVAHKSDAFFMAMRSHDALMEQMTETIDVVKALRGSVRHLDQTLVQDSLRILKLKRARSNYVRVYQKLKLMASVRETQPMIQLLLSTPDYVAALDLIQTSQEMLKQELPGILSFRHLGSQLHEMGRLIDKMLSAEFERYATADLNRPLNEKQGVLEGDKLVSIILGLLRQKHFNFIDTYKSEAFTTIRAVVKQLVIEVVAASDGISNDADLSLGDQMQALSVSEWFGLIQQATDTLMSLVLHVKAVHDVMRDAADVSAGVSRSSSRHDSDAEESASGHISVCEPPDIFLSSEEHGRVCSKLEEMLGAVCDSAHERCAQLLCAQPSSSRDSSASSSNSHNHNVVNGNSVTSSSTNSTNPIAGWLVERASPSQVCSLNKLVERFCEQCHQVSGRQSSALRSAFKMQASKFVVRFHQERRNKLSLILDSERWRQADVPAEFQALVTRIHSTGIFGSSRPESKTDEMDSEQPVADILQVGSESFAVVGSWSWSNSECRLGYNHNHKPCSGISCPSVAPLANTTCSGLLSISSGNAAGNTLIRTSASNPLVQLDTVEKDVSSHVQEIETKVLTIVSSLLSVQLDRWEVKPPVPSQQFRNISSIHSESILPFPVNSRHLSKLHKAIGGIMPGEQVQRLYRGMHRNFKDKVWDHLARIGVVNNGGPQHGVVTAELTFYLETLRSLKVLPLEELGDQTLQDVWR